MNGLSLFAPFNPFAASPSAVTGGTSEIDAAAVQLGYTPLSTLMADLNAIGTNLNSDNPFPVSTGGLTLADVPMGGSNNNGLIYVGLGIAAIAVFMAVKK